MSKRYTISYTLTATTEYEAVSKAAGMLREDVQLRYMESAVELAPGWWKVTLRVSEDS